MEAAHAATLTAGVANAKTHTSGPNAFAPTPSKLLVDATLRARDQHSSQAAHWAMRAELLVHMGSLGDASTAAHLQACVLHACGFTTVSELAELDQLVREKHAF